MAKLLLLNGPNLNLLGQREPELYGSTSLSEIEDNFVTKALELGHQAEVFQSNSEGAMIDRIHQAASHQVDIMVYNPAAYTHTSVALRDAILAVAIPFIEIHLTNINAREQFRQQSLFSDIAIGCISGFAANSYQLGLQAADAYLKVHPNGHP